MANSLFKRVQGPIRIFLRQPHLLNGCENEFWNFAGQAPNMAVLVEEGRVVLKQSCFDYQEIREVLGEGM